MKRSKCLPRLATAMLSVAITLPLVAQDTPKTEDKSATTRPGEADMMATMMEMAKPGENHKIFAGLVGTWTYTVKWWMSPQTPPSESTGTTVCKSVMDGRYFISNHTGKLQMPGSDGKMMDMEFQGMSIEGYDNAKKKYVSSWIDNMGTGIENFEGTYDPATKTLTYVGSYEPMPGMVTNMRQKLTLTDADHHTMEMFEIRGGTDVKTMEIVYTRKTT
jgi:hypothetical protein